MKTQKDNTRCCSESGTPHTHDGTEIQPKHTPKPLPDESTLRVILEAGMRYAHIRFDKEPIARAVNSHDELVEFAEMVSRSACDSQYLSTICICFSCKAKRLVAKIGRKQ